jgi:hypothetical protein
MVYDPTQTPTNRYADVYKSFCEQTRDHVLTVEVDDDINRRMRVGTPGTIIWSWNLITWPGYLTTVGDIADGYTFTRIADMIEFFDRSDKRHQEYYSDGAPSIDFRYWAEKLSGGRSLSVRIYSHSTFLGIVKDSLLEHDELSLVAIAEINADDPDTAVVLTKKREEILEELEHVGESYEDAYQFFVEHEELVGSDPWDHDLTDFDPHFVRACYAIELSVRLWREYEASEEARAHRHRGDGYVLVEGGLVQNNPALPVFDLDVLDADSPGGKDAHEALDLYERIIAHPEASEDLGSTLASTANFIRTYGAPDDVLALELREQVRLSSTVGAV